MTETQISSNGCIVIQDCTNAHICKKDVAMIIAQLITRSEAQKRIKKGKSAFGLLDDWNGILYFDLNNKKLCEAFMQRFPKKEVWLLFASSIENVACSGKEMNVAKGKYLIRDEKLVQYKTVRRLYKDFSKSEEEELEREKLLEEKMNEIYKQDELEMNKENK